MLGLTVQENADFGEMKTIAALGADHGNSASGCAAEILRDSFLQIFGGGFFSRPRREKCIDSQRTDARGQ